MKKKPKATPASKATPTQAANKRAATAKKAAPKKAAPKKAVPKKAVPKKAAPKKAAPKKAVPKKAAPKKTAPKKAAPKKSKPKAAGKSSKNWVKFVADHGVVLASARGPVPSVAEAIAGEPIIGSWWSHPKAQVIFDALSSIDDSDDVRCFKLIDGKITFVHRAKWPALIKLAEAGVLARDRVASIEQEHMPTGEHRNMTTAFPDWVPEDVSTAAAELSLDEAKSALGSWI